MKTFENQRKVGSDDFVLSYSRRSNLLLQDYLNQFNLDDYIIFKKTGNFKIITKDELMEEKYLGYLFIRNKICL